MRARALGKRVLLSAVVLGAVHTSARSADFNWKRFDGQTINFLANVNPIGNAIIKHLPEFETKTGIKVVVDRYPEQPMRQRLLTALNAHSAAIDVFMTLPSLEGEKYAKSGWYADLSGKVKEASPDYDPAGFSKALLDGGIVDGKLTSLPINVDGPVLFYRKDLLQKCGVSLPTRLEDFDVVLKKLRACEPAIAPFVTRGLKPAVAYTYSNFLHNMGGSFMSGGKSSFCSPQGKAALGLYGRLLREDGPPGVVNASFYQVADIYRAGRAAIAFESINQLDSIMENPARAKDTDIALLPPGKRGSVPTVIGWGLAISAFSKKQDPAWYFVQWATSPQVQAEIALDGVAVPRVSAEAGPAYSAWVAKQPIRKERQKILKQMMSTGSSDVGFPIIGNQESRQYIGEAVDDLILQQGSIDQACANADAKIKALIARN